MDNLRNDDSTEKRFWFNLKTLKVEEGLKSAATYRVGPFETREEASRALKILRERSESWSKQDEQED